MSTVETASLNPSTGDYAWDANRSALALGNPDVEAVIRVLRTPKGSFLPDPTYGVDFTAFAHRRPNVAADAQRELLRALRQTISLRGLHDVTITVTISRESILYVVAFRSRAGSFHRIRDTF